MKKILIPLFFVIFTLPTFAIDAFSVIVEIPTSSNTYLSLRDYKSDNTVTDFWKAKNGGSYLDAREEGEPASTYGWKYDGKKFTHYEIKVPSLFQDGKNYSYNPGIYEFIFDFNRNVLKALKDNVIVKEWKILSHNFGNPSKIIGENFIDDYRFTEQRKDNFKTTEPNMIADSDKVYSAASGSGFAVTSDGYVVTNYHVIEGCTDVKIHDKGKSILATLITFDPNNDIALLKGDFKPRSFYPLSRKTPTLLMDIYAAGYPFGQDMSTSVKVTQGIISSLTGVANNFSNLQIDAALQPGNSGGPIMNNKGNVVGVAVAKLDLEKIVDNYGVVPENVNFGVKSNLVINILESENIKLPSPNAGTITKKELVKLITEGTYYLSCWMTLAQIEKMQETKVMFKDL